MIARIKSAWFSINASYWFYPALFAIIAFVMALGLIELDRAGMADWLNRIEWLHPARPDGASDMLTVLAGSMIGVASTVFSITIAAVAYASGTYGPRLLTNFMEDRGNQFSLATFIGTFVYAITVLRTVRGEDEASVFAVQADTLPGFVPQLALLVAFGLMIISVAVLVFFLHHIPSSIRINAVLEQIGRDVLHFADRRFPDEYEGGAFPQKELQGETIAAQDQGYIRVIDLGSLKETAKDRGIEIALLVRTGDFLHVGKPMARVNTPLIDDDIGNSVRNSFVLGGSRSPEQDIEFLIDELVEIALRALSPGINDPFTAINAIHWLGALTALLGNRDLRLQIGDSDHGESPIHLLDDDFSHFVSRGFGAARGTLAGDRLAALVAFDTIRDAALSIDDPQRRDLLVRQGEFLMEMAAHKLSGPDLEDVRERYEEFAKAFPD